MRKVTFCTTETTNTSRERDMAIGKSNTKDNLINLHLFIEGETTPTTHLNARKKWENFQTGASLTSKLKERE